MSIKVKSGIICGFVKTLFYSRKGMSIKVKNGRRRRDLIVGAPDSRSSGLGSSLGRGTALCSWARRRSPPRYINGYRLVNLLLCGVALRWTSIPSRRE